MPVLRGGKAAPGCWGYRESGELERILVPTGDGAGVQLAAECVAAPRELQHRE